jgi:hypothetical protein
MTWPVATFGENAESPARRYRAGTLSRVVAFLPLWTLIVLLVVSTHTFGGGIAKPPAIVGVPLGVVMEGLALLWMAIGAALIWTARSPLTEVLVHIFFTAPATLFVIFGPAVLLIMQNLAP